MTLVFFFWKFCWMYTENMRIIHMNCMINSIEDQETKLSKAVQAVIFLVITIQMIKANGYVCQSEMDGVPCYGSDKKHDCEPYCKFVYGKTFIDAECVVKELGEDPICMCSYSINKPC